jgi:hypothetical protein
VTLTFKKPKSPEGAAYAALLGAAAKQTGGKRRVRKTKGGGATHNGEVATFASCGCPDYEITADGTVYTLYSVTEFEDGSCICDYY